MGYRDESNPKSVDLMRPYPISAAILALVAVFTSQTNGQEQTGTESAQQAAQRLVSGHVAWKTKLSSEGASIRATEVERHG